MPTNAQLVLAVSLLFSLALPLAATGFAPLPAASLLAGFALSLTVVARAPVGPLLRQPVESRWLSVCLAVALLTSILGGQGHFVFAKDDWLYRDAVLADLTSRWLPVVYSIEGTEYFLRAPIGMFLAPAAIGHWLGLAAAHFAQLTQNALILGGFFYIVTLVWPQRRLALVILFLAFAGLSVIPVALATGGDWLPHYFVFWAADWNYSGNLGQYFWNPNHVLPGWWFVALALLYLRGEIDLATVAAATAPMALWSPLTLIGAAPIFILLALHDPRGLLTSRFLAACVAALALAPVFFYFALDGQQVPRKWLIFEDGFARDYVYFIVFALAPTYFAARNRALLEPWFRSTLLLATVILFLLPLYRIGVMNDLAQKGAIVPQAFVALGFITLMFQFFSAGKLAAGAFAAGMMAVAAAEPALETYDSLVNPRFAFSDCNLVSTHRKLMPRESFLSTYLARLDRAPDWIRRSGDAPAREENRLCWPDRMAGETRFDYLAPTNRLWLRAPTAAELAEDIHAPRPTLRKAESADSGP